MNSNLDRTNVLVVNLYGRRIGVINRVGFDRHLFSFNQEYIDDPKRPTLSLSFKGETGDLITSVRPYQLKLPPFFSNLLPEGHLRTYLAQKNKVKPEHEFFLLAALGADLPGALTIFPIEMDQNDDEQQLNLKEKEKRNETALRFSLAGVQLKFSAILEASGGLTIPSDGMNGSWIVKLPSARFPAVPENEYVMLALARSIGIMLPKNHLMDIKDIRGLPEDVTDMEGRALAIARFDRNSDNQKTHMEDFAQVFGIFPVDKYKYVSYANIASVLWAETGETGTFEFIRRLIYSVLIGNADMHLKNWSILYPDKRTPVLSPAYDLLATLPYIQKDQLALSFGGSRRLSEITPDQIRRFADTAKLPVSSLATLVLETIEKTVTAWETLDEKDLLPTDIKNAIDKQILTVAENTQRLFRAIRSPSFGPEKS
jgi:serine/threonine-protein kinase HipA